MNDEFSDFLVGSIVGLSGWFFGTPDGFMKVLIASAIIDYITGLCKAYMKTAQSIGGLFIIRLNAEGEGTCNAHLCL